MTALLMTASGTASLASADLASGLPEAWLQALLFQHPELIPLTQIEPGSGQFVPVVRELTIPKPGGGVYLDLFGVTPFGRPVLIECKLWRNPQARREVVAQILEYAALLRRWSYADLTARLKARLPSDLASHQNPLYEIARRHGSPLNESVFTDSVATNLRHGDFHLIIGGDGIREDMIAIAEHIRDQGARLALVEFQRWSDGNGNTVVVPHIPFRTQVVRQRLLVFSDGVPVGIHQDETPATGNNLQPAENDPSPERQASAAANRAFWQDFIDRAAFDHPDQPPPRHGGNNWVKIPLPSPARWLTAYRGKGRAGLFLVEEEGSGLLARLAEDISELQTDIGTDPIRLQSVTGADGGPQFGLEEPLGHADQMAWLLDAANRVVAALRPRLAKMADSRPTG